MREILFRGKRKDNGEWVYGHYCGYDLEDGSSHHCIFQKNKINADFVINETVGQYTGIEDKNGAKIFEGDIIDFTFFYYGETEIEEQKKGPIVFDDYSFVFISENWRYCLSDLTFDSKSDIEIIGNIHDTPELLEGQAHNAE